MTEAYDDLQNTLERAAERASFTSLPTGLGLRARRETLIGEG